MLSPFRLSVCDVGAPYSAGEIFGNFSSPFGTLAIHGRFYGDRPRGTGTPPSGGLNARGVAKYSDFSHLECCISETVQDMT